MVTQNKLKIKINAKKGLEGRSATLNQALDDIASMINDVREEQGWNGIHFAPKYVAFYKKWLLTARSIYYTETEMTLMTFEIVDNKVCIESPILNNLGRGKRVEFNEDLQDHLIDAFLEVSETDAFKIKMVTYKDLAQKPSFELTVFWADYIYTPENIVVNVPHDTFASIFDVDGKMKQKQIYLANLKANLAFAPPGCNLSQYDNKNCEVNGFRGVFHYQADDDSAVINFA